MNLTEAYKAVYYGEEDLLMDLIELCSIYEFFDTEEDAIFFAEELIDQNLCGEFLNGLAETMEIDSSYYLSEQDLFENKAQIFRGIINALSAAGRAKAGLPKLASGIRDGVRAPRTTTALGKLGDPMTKGISAASSSLQTTIRTARKANTPVPVEKPGKYALMQFKKGIEKAVKTPALPPAKPAAATPKPPAKPAAATPKPPAKPAAATPKPPAKPAAQPKLKGWDAHKQALDNTKTFMVAFLNTYMKPAAKKVKGAAADPWKQFMRKSPVQRGLPKTGWSSPLPTTKALPSSGMRGAQAVRSGQGSTAGVKSTTMKDPYPANLQNPAPKPKFGNATDIGAPETPTKYMKLTAPKATPAPKPAAKATTPKRTPADAGMPFRATGKGGDARTQRLASQSAPGSGLNPREVKAQANRMTSGADALNKARRAMAGAAAGAVAASAAVPLVSGEKKSSAPTEAQKATKAAQQKAETRKAMAGDSRDTFKRSPKELAGDFDTSFAAARKAGRKTFSWRGKEYTTKLKNEGVDNFDLLMDHLLSEGYVETNEEALIMMSALDEGAIIKLARMAANLIKKPGASKLTKTALPPKMDPALKAVKDMVRKQYGGAAIMGSSEQKYAAARRAAQTPKKPATKPADRYPGDVYSKDGTGGIRGYRSGD